MDLASLKDLDLNDIITKLKSGALADKKTLIKFGVGFVAILIFLIGYYAFVSPIVNQQKEQIGWTGCSQTAAVQRCLAQFFLQLYPGISWVIPTVIIPPNKLEQQIKSCITSASQNWK